MANIEYCVSKEYGSGLPHPQGMCHFGTDENGVTNFCTYCLKAGMQTLACDSCGTVMGATLGGSSSAIFFCNECS